MVALLALPQVREARADRCLDDRPVLAAAGPWQVAVTAGAGASHYLIVARCPADTIALQPSPIATTRRAVDIELFR